MGTVVRFSILIPSLDTIGLEFRMDDLGFCGAPLYISPCTKAGLHETESIALSEQLKRTIVLIFTNLLAFCDYLVALFKSPGFPQDTSSSTTNSRAGIDAPKLKRPRIAQRSPSPSPTAPGNRHFEVSNRSRSHVTPSMPNAAKVHGIHKNSPLSFPDPLLLKNDIKTLIRTARRA